MTIEEQNDSKCLFGHEELKKILPQAYPFLLIDRVVEFKKNEYLIAEKNFTQNEWIFGRTDRDIQYVPETLLIEAAAQAGLVLHWVHFPHSLSKVFLTQIKSTFSGFVPSIQSVRFHVSVGRIFETSGFIDIDIFQNEMSVSDVRVFYHQK